MKWIFSQNLALGRIPLQIPSRVKFNLRICDTHNFVVGAPTGNCSACLCWFTMEGEFPNKFDIHTHSINTTCQSRYLSYQRNHSSIVQWEQRWSCFYSLSLSIAHICADCGVYFPCVLCDADYAIFTAIFSSFYLVCSHASFLICSFYSPGVDV